MTKKMTLTAFVLMIITSVFGVTNIGTAFYRMGYAASTIFIIAGLLFFIPFVMMVIEMGSTFKDTKGGIFTWMEKNVSVNFAFTGILLWYSSYVIWMFAKAINMWIPLSFALFGKDITTDLPTWMLSIVAIGFVGIVTLLIKYGPGRFSKVSSIGGIAVVSLNILLLGLGLIVFMANGFQLKDQVTGLGEFFVSPNPSFQSTIGFLGFFVFAIFAFGGVEAIGGIADDLENPERDLKKGISIAAIFTIVCYVVGIFMVGAIMDWQVFETSGQKIGSLSALYLIMDNLGQSFGELINFDPALMGTIFMRYSAISMFTAFLGAFVALSYAPLKQIIEGSPKEFWPESFKVENKYGVVYTAVLAQTAVVVGLLVLRAISGFFSAELAAALYENLVTMTNVGMTIPVLFIIYAYIKFRTEKKYEREITMINSDGTAITFAWIAFVLVFFGNFFTIIEPFLGDPSGYMTGVWTIAGPVIFGTIAIIMGKKRDAKLRK